MRIALVTCVYPPYMSGMGNVAASHAHHLRDLGHEVVVFCPAHDDAPGWQEVDGIRVERLRPTVRHGNSALVPQLLTRMRGFDAAYLHYPFFGGLEFAVIAARARRIPYVVFFHMDVLWDGWRGAVLKAYERFVEPWLLLGARAVLASSTEYADARSPSRVRGLVITESPFSLDLDRFHPPAHGGELADPPVVLHVGAMDQGHAFKGVPQMIDAFARVRAEGVPCQLTLVGDGELRPSFEERARLTGYADDITFLGRASDEDLARAYRSAAVTVLPSTTAEEAFGVVLIEAMASGCPVVASDLPGVASVARSGGGTVVAPGDVAGLAAALEPILTDPARRAAMSRAALAAIPRYHPDSERDRLARAFAGIAGS